MGVKTIVLAVAFLLSASTLTLAQSDYTTGTAESSAAAGLPTPYGYGGGLYAYVPPRHGYGHAEWRRD
jgi:hypothetical protein